MDGSSNENNDGSNPVVTNGSSDEERALRKTFVSSTLIAKKIISSKELIHENGLKIIDKLNKEKSSSASNSTLKQTSSSSSSTSQNNNPSNSIVNPLSKSKHDGLDEATLQNISLLQQQLSRPSVKPVQMKDMKVRTCFICLCDYEEGDIVCCSPNSQCVHMFHQNCIEEWLMRHDDCPCCRNDYLTVNSATASNDKDCELGESDPIGENDSNNSIEHDISPEREAQQALQQEQEPSVTIMGEEERIGEIVTADDIDSMVDVEVGVARAVEPV